LLAVSCQPEFVNPLPLPAEPKVDIQITGFWWRTTEGDDQQLLVYPRKDGWVDIIYVYDINSKLSADGVSVLIFEGYTTSLGDQKYMCFRLRKKDIGVQTRGAAPEKLNFLMVNYKLSNNGDLVVNTFSSEEVKKLINQDKLSGQIFERDLANGQLDTSVVVTSSSTELAKVLSEEGVQRFIGQGKYDTMTFTKNKN
jgi:hypothetical protein